MEREGLFTRTVRYVVVPSWQRLASAGDFDEAYLYLTSRDHRSVETPHFRLDMHLRG
jgi:hypothetical protein